MLKDGTRNTSRHTENEKKIYTEIIWCVLSVHTKRLSKLSFFWNKLPVFTFGFCALSLPLSLFSSFSLSLRVSLFILLLSSPPPSISEPIPSAKFMRTQRNKHELDAWKRAWILKWNVYFIRNKFRMLYNSILVQTRVIFCFATCLFHQLTLQLFFLLNVITSFIVDESFWWHLQFSIQLTLFASRRKK